MDRRDVIKFFSVALGYSLTPVSIASLANSYMESGKEVNWKPRFFSSEDVLIIEELGEAILPRTETPGSKDVSAHLFVDIFLENVATTGEQKEFIKGMIAWREAFKDQIGNDPSGASMADYHENLFLYFNIDKEVQKVVRRKLSNRKFFSSPEKEKYLIYSFLIMFKRLIMLGYYASEEIGENVLSYLPIPGRYEECIPVESVGNVWALG